jgi:hypothetical protein
MSNDFITVAEVEGTLPENFDLEKELELFLEEGGILVVMDEPEVGEKDGKPMLAVCSERSGVPGAVFMAWLHQKHNLGMRVEVYSITDNELLEEINFPGGRNDV